MNSGEGNWALLLHLHILLSICHSFGIHVCDVYMLGRCTCKAHHPASTITCLLYSYFSSS